MVLSYHTGFKKFDYTPIEDITEISSVKEFDGDIFMVKVVNPLNIERSIACTEDTLFYTRNRSFIPVEKLSKALLCVDEEDRTCKIVSIQVVTPPGDAKIFQVNARYNNNFFCNGILIR